MRKISISKLVGASIVIAGAWVSGASAQSQFVSIGTGGVTGVYYPAGGAICRFFNQDRQSHGYRCSVESTGGSIYNLNTLRSKELEFGIVQSDWQYHAYNGTDRFADQGKFEGLRAVFALHPEPFTVIARKDANISKFEEVAGKRLNVGNPGLGSRANAEQVLDAFGIGLSGLSLVGELKAAESPQALCDNKIDAMVVVMGHPGGTATEAATTCDVTLVDVNGPVIDKLVADNPYFRIATIPGGLYRGIDKDTQTFGVGATLVSSTDVSEDIVYTLVKSVFENFEDFKALHPAFATLKPEEMIKDGLSAPLHDGAVKYYKERGWM